MNSKEFVGTFMIRESLIDYNYLHYQFYGLKKYSKSIFLDSLGNKIIFRNKLMFINKDFYEIPNTIMELYVLLITVGFNIELSTYSVICLN